MKRTAVRTTIVIAAVFVLWRLSFVGAQPPRSAAAGSPTRPISLADDEFDRWTERLNRRVSVDFERTPLPKVVESLRAKAGCNIVLEPKVVVLKGFAVDAQREDPTGVLVTFTAANTRFETVLESILRPFDLSYYEVGDLLVLSERKQTQYFVQRAYPVADLVITSTDKGVFNSSADLIEAIIGCVDRDIWNRAGGDATIARFGPIESLLVNAPAETHRKLEQYLSNLRRGRDQTQELLKRAGLPPLQEVLRRQMPELESAPRLIPELSPQARAEQPAVSAQEVNNLREAAESALRLSLKLEREVGELKQKIESLTAQKK
jgi:hypothetical protein